MGSREQHLLPISNVSVTALKTISLSTCQPLQWVIALSLSLAAPPKEPVLMCRSNNYPKGFYCSWHLPTPTYIPNTFNISVM